MGVGEGSDTNPDVSMSRIVATWSSVDSDTLTLSASIFIRAVFTEKCYMNIDCEEAIYNLESELPLLIEGCPDVFPNITMRRHAMPTKHCVEHNGS